MHANMNMARMKIIRFSFWRSGQI